MSRRSMPTWRGITSINGTTWRIAAGTVIEEFLYSIKKEGAPASFMLKTARSTISRERETKERQYWQIPVSTPLPDNKPRARSASIS